MKSNVWGLTGKYCAGKDRIASILESKGFTVINADHLGHSALKSLKEEVCRLFGERILSSDGSIDRRELGRLVFRKPAALKSLEQLIHPWVLGEIRRVLDALGDKPVVINAALLFPAGAYRWCSKVIWVKAHPFTRLLRARRRDRLPYGQILRRMWIQRKLSPKSWASFVDIKIVRSVRTPNILEDSVVCLVERGVMHGKS